MELFRRLLLLHQTEPLWESFTHKLLSWVHPGFPVYAGPPVDAGQIASLQSQARYISRPVLATDALRKPDGGSLVLQTPGDLKTGAAGITFYPLERIDRITAPIPEDGSNGK